MKMRLRNGKTQNERGRDVAIDTFTIGASLTGDDKGHVSLSFKAEDSWSSLRAFIQLSEEDAQRLVADVTGKAPIPERI